MSFLTSCFQVLVAISLFFVWVVRYENIVSEFKEYGLPAWLRDFVGILKLTCAALLLAGIADPRFAAVGASALVVLMLAAVSTHLRLRNPFSRMVPSLALLLASVVIAVLAGKQAGW